MCVCVWGGGGGGIVLTYLTPSREARNDALYIISLAIVLVHGCRGQYRLVY